MLESLEASVAVFRVTALEPYRGIIRTLAAGRYVDRDIARAVSGYAGGPAARPSLETILSAYRPLLRHRGVLGLFASSFLRSAGSLGPLFFVGVFLDARYGLSLRQIGLVYPGE